MLALSALAPPTLVAEVVAGDKDGWQAQRGEPSSLLDLRRCIRDRMRQITLGPGLVGSFRQSGVGVFSENAWSDFVGEFRTDDAVWLFAFRLR